MTNAWTAAEIPDQSGRIAVVTGANSGIGRETARQLARRGAHVVLACRSESRAQEALDDIRADIPAAQVEFLPLDLADLEAVREFARGFGDRFERLDLLVNNAGVMVPPQGRTKQGFELQFGVNHLGHFALTGLLLGRLLVAGDARVVSVSSLAHRFARMGFDDPDFERRRYLGPVAYGQSKLANLLFTSEMARRVAQAGGRITAAAAHPGWTNTNLQQFLGPFQRLNPYFGMRPSDGALPTLRAATDPNVSPNDYYGPGGFLEMGGAPGSVRRSRAAQSGPDAERLWELSEQRTGVHYAFTRRAAVG